MTTADGRLFEAFLNQHDADAWARTLDALSPAIHEVDRDATRIWFHFFPLALASAFSRADDPQALARRLLIQGQPHLHTQIDVSHWFLYGHRYWPAVKRAVIGRATSPSAPPTLEPGALVREMATETARELSVDASLLTGITAVGLMTLQQVGLERFRAGALPDEPAARSRRSPSNVVARRQRDDSQGLFGFLKGVRRDFSVTFDERRDDARFPIIAGQHLTTAAAEDTRDYQSADPRCFAGGPIPVECRNAACGTCWVGVLGGREKLGPVDDLERTRIREFGYIDTADEHPVIRLACMAVAQGNVTIVIPSWNGIFGKFLRTAAASAVDRPTSA